MIVQLSIEQETVRNWVSACDAIRKRRDQFIAASSCHKFSPSRSSIGAFEYPIQSVKHICKSNQAFLLTWLGLPFFHSFFSARFKLVRKILIQIKSLIRERRLELLFPRLEAQQDTERNLISILKILKIYDIFFISKIMNLSHKKESGLKFIIN